MAKAPTKAQKERWSRIVEKGCIIFGCFMDANIHHCETGVGGRKNHDKVIGLCHHHHQGKQGIHTLGRRIWQGIYGSEQVLMERQQEMLGEI